MRFIYLWDLPFANPFFILIVWASRCEINSLHHTAGPRFASSWKPKVVDDGSVFQKLAINGHTGISVTFRLLLNNISRAFRSIWKNPKASESAFEEFQSITNLTSQNEQCRRHLHPISHWWCNSRGSSSVFRFISSSTFMQVDPARFHCVCLAWMLD